MMSTILQPNVVLEIKQGIKKLCKGDMKLL